MFGLLDKARAWLLKDASKRPESVAGASGAPTTGQGAEFDPTPRYQCHPTRVQAMRHALVCPPVYVALDVWRNLMRTATARIRPAVELPKEAAPTPESTLAALYADHIKACLGLGVPSPIGTQWPDLYGEFLGAVELGFGVWETVPRRVDGVWYTPLSYRDQASISAWILDEEQELAGCQQLAFGGWQGAAELPAKQMFHFAWKPASRADYSGNGLLRPMATLAEDHTLFCSLRAAAVQRFALGTPFAKVDPEYARNYAKEAKADAADLADLLEKYTSHEQGFGVLPPGWDVKLFGLEQDLSRLNAVIAAVVHEVLTIVGAQWLQLGSASSSGSWALSEQHYRAARQSAQAVNDFLAGKINATYIPRAIRWQFGQQVPMSMMPRLEFDGLEAEAFLRPEILTLLPALKAAGIFQPGPKFVGALHGGLEAPEPEPQAVSAPAKVARIVQPPPPMPEPPTPAAPLGAERKAA